jgi:hypothetical protein
MKIMLSFKKIIIEMILFLIFTIFLFFFLYLLRTYLFFFCKGNIQIETFQIFQLVPLEVCRIVLHNFHNKPIVGILHTLPSIELFPQSKHASIILSEQLKRYCIRSTRKKIGLRVVATSRKIKCPYIKT